MICEAIATRTTPRTRTLVVTQTNQGVDAILKHFLASDAATRDFCPLLLGSEARHSADVAPYSFMHQVLKHKRICELLFLQDVYERLWRQLGGKEGHIYRDDPPEFSCEHDKSMFELLHSMDATATGTITQAQLDLLVERTHQTMPAGKLLRQYRQCDGHAAAHTVRSPKDTSHFKIKLYK